MVVAFTKYAVDCPSERCFRKLFARDDFSPWPIFQSIFHETLMGLRRPTPRGERQLDEMQCRPLWEIGFGTFYRTTCTIQPIVVGHMERAKSLWNIDLAPRAENSKSPLIPRGQSHEVGRN